MNFLAGADTNKASIDNGTQAQEHTHLRGRAIWTDYSEGGLRALQRGFDLSCYL